MIKVAVIISPNYEDLARRHLQNCLASIRKQDWTGDLKIFMTDNRSTEESFVFLKETGPEIDVIRNENNDGFAGGNNLAMQRALEEGFDYLVLLNMDAIAEADCVSRLVQTAQSDAAIGAVQARIMLRPETNKVNSLGNETHFLGFGYCGGYGQDWSGTSLAPVRDIGFPSGAATLYKKETLESLGLFDEEYRMYNEDQDLGWRIWLSGWRCVLASGAVVYHRYEFTGEARKYYWLDRNRILTILKHYELTTLLFIFPAFVFMEFGLLLFAFQKGWLREKMKVYGYFLNFRNWRYIVGARHKSQTLRRLKDRDMVGMICGRIWYDEIGDWKLRAANAVLAAYLRVVQRIIMKQGAVG